MKTTRQLEHSQKDCSTLATLGLLGLCLELPLCQGSEIAVGLLSCKALGGPRDAVVEAGVSNCFERARITCERPKGPKAVKGSLGEINGSVKAERYLVWVWSWTCLITQKCRCFSATLCCSASCGPAACSLHLTASRVRIPCLKLKQKERQERQKRNTMSFIEAEGKNAGKWVGSTVFPKWSSLLHVSRKHYVNHATQQEEITPRSVLPFMSIPLCQEYESEGKVWPSWTRTSDFLRLLIES